MADALIDECLNVLSQSEMSIFWRVLQSGSQGRIPYHDAKMLAVRIVARRNLTLAYNVEEFLNRDTTHGTPTTTLYRQCVPRQCVPRQGVMPPEHVVRQQGVIEIQEQPRSESFSPLEQPSDMDFKSMFAAFL